MSESHKKNFLIGPLYNGCKRGILIPRPEFDSYRVARSALDRVST